MKNSKLLKSILIGMKNIKNVKMTMLLGMIQILLGGTSISKQLNNQKHLITIILHWLIQIILK